MGKSKFRSSHRLLDILPVTSEKCLVCVRKGQSLYIGNTQMLFNKLPMHYLTPTLLQRLTMSLKAASSPDLLMI